MSSNIPVEKAIFGKLAVDKIPIVPVLKLVAARFEFGMILFARSPVDPLMANIFPGGRMLLASV